MGRSRGRHKWKAEWRIGLALARAHAHTRERAGVGKSEGTDGESENPGMGIGGGIGQNRTEHGRRETYSAEACTHTAHSIGASERSSDVLSISVGASAGCVADSGYR